MKKIIFAPLALVVFITSCTSNSESTEPAPAPAKTSTQLFTSSNTTGKVSFLDLETANPTVKSFAINSLDADGVYYDNLKDEVIVASRSNNKVEAYGNFTAAVKDGLSTLALTSSSTSDFTNSREIAVAGDKIIVAQDQNASNNLTNKFIVYTKFDSGLISFTASYTLNFKAWSMQMVGNTLFAIADATGDLVIFNNFLSNPSGPITPSKRVTIQGLVRTHGITISEADNRMILTDVGSATSDSDGGIIVINNYNSVLSATANAGTVMTTDQVRIYGPNSTLGNPVDVAYDNITKKIYIAERLNMGGRVLTFALPTTNADASPENARVEPGVTSVYLFKK